MLMKKLKYVHTEVSNVLLSCQEATYVSLYKYASFVSFECIHCNADYSFKQCSCSYKYHIVTNSWIRDAYVEFFSLNYSVFCFICEMFFLHIYSSSGSKYTISSSSSAISWTFINFLSNSFYSCIPRCGLVHLW